MYNDGSDCTADIYCPWAEAVIFMFGIRTILSVVALREGRGVGARGPAVPGYPKDTPVRAAPRSAALRASACQSPSGSSFSSSSSFLCAHLCASYLCPFLAVLVAALFYLALCPRRCLAFASCRHPRGRHTTPPPNRAPPLPPPRRHLRLCSSSPHLCRRTLLVRENGYVRRAR